MVPKHALPSGERDLAFPPEEYQQRVEQVRQRMRERQLDALLVHHPFNVCYLSGYQSINMFDSECFILPLDGEPALLVPERELGGALLYTSIETPTIFRRTEYPDTTFRQPMQAAADALAARRLDRARIGVERRSMAVAAQKFDTLRALLPAADLLDASGLVEGVKARKSPREIAHLRRAAEMTNHGMRAAIDAAAEGKTDNDLAAAAYFAMMSAGSEYLSLAPIVTVGARAGIIHSTHRRVRLHRGEGVNIELGACYHRYMAPCMRTIAIGEPNACVKRLAHACLTALNNVLQAMRPGATADDVARAGMEGIEQAGENVIFHGCFGYSVGASFPPSWADGAVSLFLDQSTRLESGMVFHIPMGLRRLGECGAMFSETALITDDGCEPLTNVERALRVIAA